MKWVTKAILQKFFSLIPFGFYVNQFFKIIRKTENDPADYFTNYLRFLTLKTALEFLGNNYKEKKFLEFGAGWSVELPAIAYCLEVKNFDLIDIRDLRRNSSVRAKLGSLYEALEKASKEFNDYSIIKSLNFDRLRKLKDIKTYNEFLELTKYKYKKVNFLDISDKYDVIISINTLEHIKLKNLI